MTGDGAVVRLWQFNDGWLGVWAPREGDTLEPLTFDHMIEEHNALVAHALAQAAEIERLTARLQKEMDDHFTVEQKIVRRAEASEASAADLLKALPFLIEICDAAFHVVDGAEEESRLTEQPVFTVDLMRLLKAVEAVEEAEVYIHGEPDDNDVLRRTAIAAAKGETV